MMVACILINRTHWRQVKPVLEQLRERYPSPKRLISGSEADLIEIIRPLGFYNRRATSLRRFAQAWEDNPPVTWFDIWRMPGCSTYAAQSWQIFVQNEVPKGEITDHKLQWYLEHRMGKE